MKKIIKLTEQDLTNIIKSVLGDIMPNLGDYLDKNKGVKTNLPNKTTSDDEFYKKVLECIGAKPTKDNMLFMYAWRQSEGGQADFNPLNTTKSMSNATNYNSVGVKNYKNIEDGIKATCDTLKLSHYRDIVEGLKNDVGLYELSRMQGLKKWGTGELLAKVVDGYLAGASPKPKPIEIA
jgi:hypothetical protein